MGVLTAKKQLRHIKNWNHEESKFTNSSPFTFLVV